MDINSTLNEVLVKLFRSVNTIEEKAFRTEEYQDVTTNDMHVIEAVGLDTAKNMTSVAKTLEVTTGTLTIAVNSLVKKGYVRKVQSQDDRREFHLEPTQKYIDYYNISASYTTEVVKRANQRFTPEECSKLEQMLTIVSRELMPEVVLPEAQAQE